MQDPRLLLSTDNFSIFVASEISVQLMVANSLLNTDCTVHHIHVSMHLKPTFNIGRNGMRTINNAFVTFPISGFYVLYEVGSTRHYTSVVCRTMAS